MINMNEELLKKMLDYPSELTFSDEGEVQYYQIILFLKFLLLK